MVHDDLSILCHRQVPGSAYSKVLGVEIQPGGHWGGDHDRLGPGDGPHDGGRRSLGVGSIRPVFWYSHPSLFTCSWSWAGSNLRRRASEALSASWPCGAMPSRDSRAFWQTSNLDWMG